MRRPLQPMHDKVAGSVTLRLIGRPLSGPSVVMNQTIDPSETSAPGRNPHGWPRVMRCHWASHITTRSTVGADHVAQGPS